MCLRERCIPTEPWYEDGAGERYALPWMEIIKQDMSSTAVTCCLGTSALTDPGDLGVGFARSQPASPQSRVAGVTGGTVVPCVFAEPLVTPHAGVMLVHHTATLSGFARVCLLLVPPLAAGSHPSVRDGLVPESTAHGIKGVCPHAGGTL